jgi:hypothetical protein
MLRSVTLGAHRTDVRRETGGSDEPVRKAHNGILASQLTCADWTSGGHRGGVGAAGPQLAALPGGSVALRDAQDPDGPALVYTYAEIEAFIAGVKDGEFDDLTG